jgi:gas vesicle protein
MMNFVFPPVVEAAIAAGKYAQVYTSAGVPIGMARDAATGQFVAHAVGATVNDSPLSPLVSAMQFVMGGQMQQTQMGFQAVQASLGVLQATTAVIGVGTLAGVALSAVNLHQTLKLKKAVERLEVKVENGFINLEQLLKDQGTEIKQLIFQVVEEMKFENHRLVLVRAYGLFTQAIQRMRSALQLKDIDRRNAEIDAARGMLFEALADYRNPQLLEETCAAGQLRRLECSWAIEQSIIATYQVQNEFGAASDRISQLQANIRQDGLRIIDACDSDDELDFLFPEIARIHNHDLVLLDSWQNQIEWTKALPKGELKLLQSADFSASQTYISEEAKSAKTALVIPPEQLIYENLRPKSHFYSLCTQLELMLEPQRREEYESYIIKQGEIAGYKTFVGSNLEKASDLAVANLYHYLKVRDESEDESENEPEINSQAIKEDSQAMKEFGLTPEQTRIMFSYQYHLVQADIDNESNSEKKFLKREWLRKWKASTELFLNSQITASSPPGSSFDIITDFELLKNLVKSSLIAPGNQLTRCLILLEVTLFQPYYPLGDNRDEAFKDLKIADEEKLTNKLRFFARTLDIDPDSVHRFKSNYKEAIKGIKGGVNPWLVATAGAVVLGVVAIFATPLIVGLLAPILAPGLSGAAAVSAVLAALGGGAIAAGGFGMAGGMAVIVAGGSILGASAGVGVGALFGQSPDAALTQAAKLEVVMREIVSIQKDIRKAQEIIKEQRIAIRSLEDKCDDLLLNKEKNQKEIENLKKAIEYLKKALERNQGLK